MRRWTRRWARRASSSGRRRFQQWIERQHVCARSPEETGGRAWRWVFFINVPVGLAVLLLTAWKVSESPAADQRRRFDWGGGLLAVLGLGGVVFAFINSRPAMGLEGAIFLIGLLCWETRSSSPMLPLSLFRSLNFSGANLLTLFLYSGLSGARFDPGARVHSNPGRRRPSALHPVDVSVVALVGWTSRSIRRKSALGDRPFDRRDSICAIHSARHRRVVLDNASRRSSCLALAWRSAWPR
jgi:hypothetical protein